VIANPGIQRLHNGAPGLHVNKTLLRIACGPVYARSAKRLRRTGSAGADGILDSLNHFVADDEARLMSDECREWRHQNYSRHLCSGMLIRVDRDRLPGYIPGLHM
jgi:hypothetical protein